MTMTAADASPAHEGATLLAEGTGALDPAAAGADDPVALALLDCAAARSPRAGAAEQRGQGAQVLLATLRALPLEVGTADCPSAAELAKLELALGPLLEEWPEAAVCRLWISLLRGESRLELRSALTALAAETLWHPVQALALRGLVACGARAELAHVLAGIDRNRPAAVEAGLEALLPAGRELDALYPTSELVARAPAWGALLEKELKLAGGDDPLALDAGFAALFDGQVGKSEVASPHAELGAGDHRENDRFLARLLAARARATIACGRDPRRLFDEAGVERLPAWEVRYLRGVGAWRAGDLAAARTELEASSQSNPRQSAVALSRATLLAERDPGAALDVLNGVSPSREVLVARASLLARMRDYELAERSIREAEVTGCEPVRLFWAEGRRGWRRRELQLRAALAERHGDATSAERTLAGLEAAEQPLRTARSAWTARRALIGNDERGFQRSVLERKLKGALGTLGSGPLLRDALFFRAAAAAEFAPEQSARDLGVLAGRRAWLERERRAGGNRLLFMSDMLLGLGRVDEARLGYGSASGDARLAPIVAERSATALVLRELVAGTDAADLDAAFARAEELAPTSPYPSVVAAFAAICNGDSTLAQAHGARAAERGCPAALSSAVLALATAVRHGTALAPEAARELGLGNGAQAGLALSSGDAGTEPEEFLGAIDGADATFDRALAACGLAGLCERGRFQEAEVHAGRLVGSGAAWAADLLALVRLRRAVALAKSGDFDAAERALSAVETLEPSRPSGRPLG
jgi:hypothetical protein